MSPGTKQAEQVKQLTNINPLWIAIPASCDFCGSTLMFVALTMTPASVYQMMRGIIVVITALMSICFLGRKQYRHHWTAIFLIIFGVFAVGYVSVKAGGSEEDTNGSEILGIALLLFSQCFSGVMFITEEKILGNYYLDPFQVVGTEGMWGLCYWMLCLPVMQLIKCGGPDAHGLGTLCNFGYLENSAFAFT
jgi:drug/metabolite transporter (DMT)-like permease